jgi:hypothetical protein
VTDFSLVTKGESSMMDSSADCFVGLEEEALAVDFGLALSCAALGAFGSEGLGRTE